MGSRSQATLQLSCPGVGLEPLEGWADPTQALREPMGLDSEARAIAAEYGHAPVRRWLAKHQKMERALLRDLSSFPLPEGFRTVQQDRVRTPPTPTSGDLSPTPLPGPDEPLENLPIFFDESEGRVSLRDAGHGWELLRIHESGESVESLGVYRPPDPLPRLGRAAERLLRGYLRYSAARDHVLWAAAARAAAVPGGTLASEFDALLRWAGASALARGAVIAEWKGEPADRLSREFLERGIRATDAELMDRPSLGIVL